MPLFKNPLDSIPKPDMKMPEGASNAKKGLGGVLGLAKPHLPDRRAIDELLLRVNLIEDDCNADKKEDELAEISDEFVRLKRSMYNDIGETKEMIRERYEIQQTRGNTVDAIQKGSKINQKIESLDTDLKNLTIVFRKQSKNKKAIGEEELDKRFKELQLLKRQIEESRSLYRNGGQLSEDEINTLTDFRAQMQTAGVAVPAAPERDLLQVEKDALNRWGEKDKEIDAGLNEVGDVVDRLGVLATTLGEKADQQAVLVKGLNEQATTANEDIVQLNDKVKGMLSKGQGMQFFCRIALALIIVCETGFVISRIMNMV